MAEWTIYSRENVAKAVVHELEYHGEWMREEFVTVTVKSAEPVDWQFDDYLTYRGEVFSISYDPNVVKKARRGTYGEGFNYDNIKLYSLGNKTKQIDFKDVVLNPTSAANTQVYTSLGKFPFFCASVEDLADRLQANFNRETLPLLPGGFKVLTPSSQRTGQRLGSVPAVWNDYYTGHEPTGETDVNIDVDNMKCWDVLKYVYEKFGLAYFIRGEYVVIGAQPIHLNTGAQNIFRYGKGLGLYEIERTSDENQEVITKLFAYGSEQNLPLNYYANLGKKIKFTIAYKRVKTNIVNHPTLYMCVDTVWTTALANAFSPNYEVTLTHGAYSARFRVTGTDFIADDTEPPLEFNTKKLVFYWIMYGEQDVQDFFDHITEGDTVYVSGVNINQFPEQFIELPQGYDYPAALAVNRLMLPGFPTQSLHAWVSSHHPELLSRYTFSTDAKDPWIKSNNVSVAGIFEGVVNYDGSQQQEIFPTIENTSSCVIYDADEIVDNGYLDEGTNIDFKIYVRRGSGYLDWSEAIANAPDAGGVYIEMKSGFCVGRKFKVTKAKNETKGGTSVWELTCERDKDSSLGRYFPYHESDVSHYCQVRTGDTFVVTGIQMPDAYIEAAAEKMLIAACGYLDKRDHVRYTYIPKIDELYMQRDKDERDTESYHDIIRAGMTLEFEDSDLGIWVAPFIDNLTIKENGNNGIPTYDVVLRDEKEKGTLEKLTESISELMANPPVQVVERQQRQLQYVEYPEWEESGLYYSETVNPDTDVLETSMVWHRGCLWMCMRTLTQQEPWFTSADWKCVRASDISLNFFDDGEEYPMPLTFVQIRIGHVDFTVVPYLLIGNEDITDGNVTEWKWTRESESEGSDEQWNALPKTSERTLNVTDEDMPTGWMRGQKLVYTCTATLAFEIDTNVNTIMNKVIF